MTARRVEREKLTTLIPKRLKSAGGWHANTMIAGSGLRDLVSHILISPSSGRGNSHGHAASTVDEGTQDSKLSLLVLVTRHRGEGDGRGI